MHYFQIHVSQLQVLRCSTKHLGDSQVNQFTRFEREKWPRALYLSTGFYQCFYTCDTVQCHENNSVSCFVEAIVGRKQICVPTKEEKALFMAIIEI